jgi:hypothetical protein
VADSLLLLFAWLPLRSVMCQYRQRLRPVCVVTTGNHARRMESGQASLRLPPSMLAWAMYLYGAPPTVFAGPCPWPKIENDGFSRGGQRTIRVSVRNSNIRSSLSERAQKYRISQPIPSDLRFYKLFTFRSGHRYSGADQMEA